jgi:hypothetical protein
MDATGLGVGLYDWLNMPSAGRVMGINFAGTNDQGVKIKTDLATRLKSRLEKRLERLPRDPQIRQRTLAIKREVSGASVKFDAPRIEVDSAVAGGPRKEALRARRSLLGKGAGELCGAHRRDLD